MEGEVPPEEDLMILRKRNKVAWALYESVKEAAIANGIEHGYAIVDRMPNGAWGVVVGRGTLIEAGFTPGGGGFGGGGASGQW